MSPKYLKEKEIIATGSVVIGCIDGIHTRSSWKKIEDTKNIERKVRY